MIHTRFAALILALSLLPGCVKKSIYQTELKARQLAEAREGVMIRELADRKSEATKLIAQIADLNQTVGRQNGDIAQLRSEIVARTTAAGQSSSQFAEEKMRLENRLATTNGLLEQRTSVLNHLQSLQNQRDSILTSLENVLRAAYRDKSTVTLLREGETLLLTLPDKELFEPAGLQISASGKNLLSPLAKFLADRPALDVDLVAYTDNNLPKGAKNLTDTWDWSLQRATNATRLLISEFGVNANQLSPVGRGEFYPVATNETPEGRQQNRRTVVVVRPVLPAP